MLLTQKDKKPTTLLIPGIRKKLIYYIKVDPFFLNLCYF